MSASDSDVPESGILPGRLEWAEEPSRGTFPTDPEWDYFSDAARTFEAEPGASLARQDNLGEVDAIDANRGAEDPTATVEYDLQRFPVSVNFEDPEVVDSASTLGVASDDSGDTGIDVTIYSGDYGTTETITTDGADGTTFATGSTPFATIGKVDVGSSPTGTITVSINSSGSAGTTLGTVSSSGVTQAVVTNDPAGYGMVRDEYNRLPGSLCIVYRRKYPGGNDGAGVREYTVVRGAVAGTVSGELDPSTEQPILQTLDIQPIKVRSYKIHQLTASNAATLSVSSTQSTADSGISATIEADDGTSNTVSMGGTSTDTFQNVDAVLLDGTPEGIVTVETSGGSSITVMEIDGGLAYSDDSQPVDGDRGVPTTGSGSHASEIGTSFEHFVGDRFERPSGSAHRPRVNSATWSIENNLEPSTIHSTRLPAVDEGQRDATVDADIGGEFASHQSMTEALLKVRNDLEHELSSGYLIFANAVPTSTATRTMETDQAAFSGSETLLANGVPAINFSEDV